MTVPSLVFIHGFLGSSNDWKKPFGNFQGLEKSVFLNLSERDRWPSQVSGVVVGYSMGGRLAVHLALASNDACVGAVIVSAGPGIEAEADRAERRERDEAWARRFESEPMERVLEAWYQQPIFASLGPEKQRELVARRSGNDARDVARQLRSLGPGVLPSLWHRLGELRMPVLFVAGEQDPKYVEIARRAAGLCPHGRAAIVPGVGHAVGEEAPDQLSELIREFAASSTRTRTRTT